MGGGESDGIGRTWLLETIIIRAVMPAHSDLSHPDAAGRPPVTSIPDPGAGRPSRRFRYVLLGYAALTALTFGVVWRYTFKLTELYGHQIDNVGVQFGLYFGIYLVLTSAGHAVATRLAPLSPLALTREGLLRLAFVGGITLSAVVASYQSGYGRTVAEQAQIWVNYFAVGALGAFAAALAATGRGFGLVEVVARPAPDVVEAVRRGHAGIALADGPGDRAKRILEALLALAIILVSLPISTLLAIAVWLEDPGPLLVAKVAVRRGGRSFHQLKLRSMVKDAEGATGPVPAAPADARVTRLGNLLRRTHIDELPQLLNILRGDMSLVGPRPERTVFVLRHLASIPRYAERHAVRPGLAGLAQVYGDYYSTPREKLRYDLLYIRNRGLVLDLKLFGAAVLLALFGVSPRHHPHRHATGQGQDQRWRRAYRALRGEAAPAAAGAPGAPRPTTARMPPAAAPQEETVHEQPQV